MGVCDSIITIVATEASSYLDVVMVMVMLLMMMMLPEFRKVLAFTTSGSTKLLWVSLSHKHHFFKVLSGPVFYY